MLLQAPVALQIELAGRDDQHPVGAFERVLERCRIVEVGWPDGDAAGREVGEVFGIARGGNDVRRRDFLRIEQMVDHGAAEMAGSAGDEEGFGHGRFLKIVPKGGRSWRSHKETSTKIGIDLRP